MNNRVQLQRSLASIATQDFTDFEVIVAEGSTSPISAVEIEESWPSLQNKVMVKNGGTSGIYEAMNIGVSFSSAPWIFFLGDDDFFVEHHCFIYGSRKSHARSPVHIW